MVRACSSSIGGGRGSKSRRKLLRGKSHKRKMSRGKARRKLSRVNSNAGDIRGFLRGARKKLLTRKRRRALDSYKKSTNKRLTAMHAAERKRMASAEMREYTERGTFGNPRNHLGRYLDGDDSSPAGKDIY